MGQETASSPVLADLDGDGAAEIVTGADAVYVWHGDASELRDGDGSAITSGVFTLDGVIPGRRGYHSVPAVADLDRDGVLDLVGVPGSRRRFRVERVVRGRGGRSLRPPAGARRRSGPRRGRGQVVVVGGPPARHAWHPMGEVRDSDGIQHRGVLLATAAPYGFAPRPSAASAGRLEVGLDEGRRLHALRAARGGAGLAGQWGRISLAGPGDLDGAAGSVAIEDDSLRAPPMARPPRLAAVGLPRAPGGPRLVAGPRRSRRDGRRGDPGRARGRPRRGSGSFVAPSSPASRT
jgi:hypothetical protein